MKKTIVDRIVGYFSPQAELRRLNARIELDYLKRAYDFTNGHSTSDWSLASATSANVDIKNAIAIGRDKARAIVQNIPYGSKAVDVIVNEVVGAGIIPNFVGRTKTQTRKLTELWKQRGETAECDFEKEQNFYGQCQLFMRSIVESGEGLALIRYNADGFPEIHIIEPDHIVTSKDEGNVVQGIELDANGLKTKFHLYKKHPGESSSSNEVFTVNASDVLHGFRKLRAGQRRGITWAHNVIEKLKDYEDYQGATLIRQKVSACLTAFVESNGSETALTVEQLQERRRAEFSLTPGTVRYLKPGETIRFSSPPTVNDTQFSINTLMGVAAGWGITYERMTGDYSRSNYSSSRMGEIQFRANVDSWRWHMLIPMFCEPFIKKFLEWAQRYVDTRGVQIEWVPPAFSMIDPMKEVLSLQREVRSGFKSYKAALLELGRDPDRTLAEIAEYNQKFDDLKISIDVDPRRMSSIGFAQAGDTLSKLSDAEYLRVEQEQESDEKNKEESATKSDSNDV